MLCRIPFFDAFNFLFPFCFEYLFYWNNNVSKADVRRRGTSSFMVTTHETARELSQKIYKVYWPLRD